MNQEIKQKWLEALRSGKYEQGKYYLNRDGVYCCLGVLCDLYLKEHNLQWQPIKKPEGTFVVKTHHAILERDVWNWAELPDENPLIKLTTEDFKRANTVYNDAEEDLTCSLAGANDMGCTFEHIADLIEKQL